jgi:hypothetical protein
MFVSQRDAKHCSRQDVHDRPLDFDRLFRIHSSHFGEQRGPESFRGRLCNQSGSTGDCLQKGVFRRRRRLGAGALRVDELHSRLARGH